jgi:predicted lipoprotein with Yx(FWY)xxD motif
MQSTFRILCFASLLLAAPAVMAAAQPRMEHPGVIALIEEEDGWVYRHAATGFRLYVTDRDTSGKSSCNGGCSRAWIPLGVEQADNNSVGDWRIIVREDGTRQWAYKGRPVYTLFHDSPENPVGEGVEGVWHYLQP